MPNVTPEWVAQQAARATFPVKEGWQAGALTVFVPGKPWNPQAGDLRHHMKKAKTVAEWRERAAHGILRAGWRRTRPVTNTLELVGPDIPKAIAFTVYSRQLFDSDNLQAVCKPLRDALKDMRIIDDDGHHRDGTPRHDFSYQNVRAPKVSDIHGIAIRIAFAVRPEPAAGEALSSAPADARTAPREIVGFDGARRTGDVTEEQSAR